ncbi:C40 family peptidase [Latilactobacillus curvatus]|uniref:C40 family peptidase n=1 Tax=Latilactobacillus curvatus TaxID=28038 RepID=UPI000FECB3BD|nr:peptidoglycan endopeptidase [Latilactobacillus curvatus]
MKFNRKVLLSAVAVTLMLGGAGITSSFTNATPVQAAVNSKQQAVVSLAQQQVGKPYVWGATGPNSFDCSGLVQYVYSHAAGINLPRVTNQQESCGSEVSLNALEPGDLLFWGNRGSTYHVAIYIGSGNFVQAPEPGQNVKVTNMKYYYPSFARRVMSDAPDSINIGALDEYSFDGVSFTAKGWTAATYSVGKPISYLLAMDTATGREVARFQINRIARPDVQRAYPNIPNSLNSGFEIKQGVPEQMMGKNIKLLARYTNWQGFNSDYTFEKSINFPSRHNIGCIDNLSQQGNSIHVAGWHASNYIQDKPYRYMFFMDKKTNKQITSVRFNTVNRPGISNAYPDIQNADNSGFDFSIPIPENMHGKDIYVISRYTSDPAGNINTVDYSANQNVLHVN